MPGIARPGPRSMEPTYLVDISAGHRRLTGSGRRGQVQLYPVESSCGMDVWRTGFLASAPGLVGQRGASGWCGGPGRCAAGDLVAARYAVGVDGEQDTHAVPGAGSDLGGRGTGGQPQRQRGMAQVIGLAGPLGPCLAPDGGGAGLVPDPAVEAFAERAATGTPEQPPVCGAPKGPQVPAEETGELRGDRDRPDGHCCVVPSLNSVEA